MTQSRESWRIEAQHLARKLSTAQEKIKQVEEKHTALEQVAARGDFKKGGSKRYFSLYGGCAMAVRKCVSNVSSYSLGLSMAMDVHPITVRGWEIKLRASRLASMRQWYNEQYTQLFLNQAQVKTDYDYGPDIPLHRWMFGFHILRCDATRALWRRQKLHTCEVVSSFIVDPVRYDDAADDIKNRTVTRKMLGDIQAVGKGTAESALGLLAKQCRSIGNRSLPHLPLPAALDEPHMPKTLRLPDIQMSGDGDGATAALAGPMTDAAAAAGSDEEDVDDGEPA